MLDFVFSNEFAIWLWFLEKFNCNLWSFQSYRDVFEAQEKLLLQLDAEVRDNPVFERQFRAFEAQKVCYLPFSAFLLKPFQRLLHYELILNSESPTDQRLWLHRGFTTHLSSPCSLSPLLCFFYYNNFSDLLKCYNYWIQLICFNMTIDDRFILEV